MPNRPLAVGCRVALFLLPVALGAAACTSWRPEPGPAPAVVQAHPAATVRLVRADGSRVVLRAASASGDSIVGEGGGARGRTAVAASEVRAVELRRTDAAKTIGLAAGAALVAVAVLYAAALGSLGSNLDY